MPFLISETSTNSFLLCDLEEFPGPIFIASHPILIQSDVVGEEKVSIPSLSTAF